MGTPRRANYVLRNAAELSAVHDHRVPKSGYKCRLQPRLHCRSSDKSRDDAATTVTNSTRIVRALLGALLALCAGACGSGGTPVTATRSTSPSSSVGTDSTLLDFSNLQ